jgi:protein PhnA
MNLSKELNNRSANKCELCGNEDGITAFLVEPRTTAEISNCIAACSICCEQLAKSTKWNVNHWRCLNDSMWSQVSAVKVVAYRVLSALKNEGWPNDLLEIIYLTEDELAWANETMEDENAIKHYDSNGIQLFSGDSIVLIKDLDVKGSSMIAKRGTAVRNIRLVQDNADLIEGKVNDQTIYILTQFTKK